MKLPKEYFEMSISEVDNFNELPKKNYSLYGLRLWVERERPKEIEMSASQFWNFTEYQDFPADGRSFWTTFMGIPLVCPDLSRRQRINIGIK